MCWAKLVAIGNGDGRNACNSNRAIKRLEQWHQWQLELGELNLEDFKG